jgi:hypothetical protein
VPGGEIPGGVIEHEDPVVPLALNRRLEFEVAFLVENADFPGRPMPRIVPPGLDLLTGELLKIHRDSLPQRRR